jgi:Protein of unknown function (DUF2911)
MRFIKSVALASVLCMATAVVAFGKVKSHVITFGQDFTVNGTQIKAGTYKLSFDDKTNELTIIDKKTKAVVAKVNAKAERQSESATGVNVQIQEKAGSQVLTSVTFPGERDRILVGDGPATASVN